MKKFHLQRLEDESGVSGTGWVAEGVEFANGKCVVSWLTKYTSVAVYENMLSLEAIHGHNGKTVVRRDGDEYAGPNCLGCHHPVEFHDLDNCGGCSVGVCNCNLMEHPERAPKEAKRVTRTRAARRPAGKSSKATSESSAAAGR
jgi:hypothetical protein